MKCADPVLCYIDSKGKRLFRNFSLARKTLRTILNLPHQVFDCGKCLSCRKKKAYELACRCVLHASLYEQNCFLTLTYDEKKENYHNEIQYSDIQKFKKRLRQSVKRSLGVRIEIFNVHEYGKRGKKHWHLIVFGYDFRDKTLYTIHNQHSLYTSSELSTLWPFGFCTIGSVTEASAMYQTQYMEKDFKNGNVNSTKKSKSNHSGIGRPYFEKHYRQILTLGYVPIGGARLPVPRYFEKLAHKHYAHYFDTSFFFDTPQRRRCYTQFRPGEANREIAELFVVYRARKEERLLDLEEIWQETINLYLTTKEDPDFIKSNANALYDLRNKQTNERF